MSQHASIHEPVMAAEVMHWLDLQPGNVVVDGTLGGGGHSRLIEESVGRGGLVICLDRDPAALLRAERSLKGRSIKLVQSNYCELPEVLQQLDIPRVDGILLDLGLSSDQLADQALGFSFDSDGPLDLRFNPETGEPAWRLIERLSAPHLADLIYQYGEERRSRAIARRIVEARRTDPVRTSAELARLVRSCFPRTNRRERIDPATRTFQALRIAVNDELRSLEIALRRFPECLRKAGRLVIISFHSLEDRPVKEAFRDNPCYEPLAKKVIRPTEDEIVRNPRSRSAKMRVARRTGHDIGD